MTTGEKIKYHRKKQGLSQKQLAGESGVSTSVLAYYEKDKADPSLFAAACIADVLGLTLDYLAGREKL